MQTQHLDFNSPDFRKNPYPFYNAARETAPLIAHGEHIHYLVTRWDDCDQVLRDKRFGRLVGEFDPDDVDPNLPEPVQKMLKIQRRWLLFMNGANHARVRNLVNKAFTPKMVHNLRDRIQTMTDDLLAHVSGELDVIADFALPLPVNVIAEMLGVPRTDYVKFRQWSEHVLGANDVVPPTPERMQKVIEVTLALHGFIADLIEEKRAAPGHDLLSSLIAAEEAGDRLSKEEMISTAMLILVAGFETTTNLIGNGVLRLMQHRDQWQKLVDQPELAASAVEEILRFDTPVQMTGRDTLETVDLCGQTLPPHKQVMVLFTSANRDPRHFTNPDVFDITRNEGQAMTFGGGIHYCLGAPLARLEGEIAFRALAQRFPNLRLAIDEESLTWRDLVVIRGLERLPATV